MTLASSEQKDIRWPLPDSAGWRAWFWSVPARPGLYGTGSLKQVMVIGNHRDELLQVSCPVGGVLLALDIGGLRLEEAIAMRRVDREFLFHALIAQGAMGGQLYLPEMLAAALHFSADESWNNWTIVLQPAVGKISGWGGMLAKQLILAVRLLVGQALLIAIPLLILSGWQGLLLGWALLLGAAVLAVLSSPLFRCRLMINVFLNCAIINSCIALVMGLGGWWLFPQSLFWMIIGLVVAIWMTLVLTGTKYSS